MRTRSMSKLVTAGLLFSIAGMSMVLAASTTQESAEKRPTSRPSREAEEKADRELSEQRRMGVSLQRTGLLGGGRIKGVSVTGWNTEALSRLQHLGVLSFLEICSHDMPDEGLKDVAKLTTLRTLGLSGPTTDDGLRNLLPLRDLEVLHLNSASITNASLKTLQEFPSLRRIHFWRCKNVDESKIKEFAWKNGFEWVAEPKREGQNLGSSNIPTITLRKLDK